MWIIIQKDNYGSFYAGSSDWRILEGPEHGCHAARGCTFVLLLLLKLYEAWFRLQLPGNFLTISNLGCWVADPFELSRLWYCRHCPFSHMGDPGRWTAGQQRTDFDPLSVNVKLHTFPRGY